MKLKYSSCRIDESGLAVDRQHQRLEGVIAGRLLAGEIEDVLRSCHDHDVDAGLGEQRCGRGRPARHIPPSERPICSPGAPSALPLALHVQFSQMRCVFAAIESSTPSPAAGSASTAPSR